MTPIIARLYPILRSECLNTRELQNSREKVMTIPPSKTSFVLGHSPDYDEFFILATNKNDIKITLMESLLINRGHPAWNKSK